MKKTIFILLLILPLLKGFSQVDKIKEDSDKNKEDSEHLSGGNGGIGGNGDSGSPCLESCGDACFASIAEVCFDFALSGIIELNKSYIDNKDDIPLVTSFDFIPQGAYHPSNSILALPRIRGNWGLFSTDFRFTSLIEITPEGSDFWNTFDWQVIQFNLLVTEPVILRIGTGFMYENYSETFFNEHTIGLDFFMDDYKYRIDNEFRISKDYTTANIPRLEGNTRFNYAVLQEDHIDGYISIGVMYQNYYLDESMWSVLGGMAFNFH